MINVSAGIIRKGNKTLIARRSPNKHLEGFWEFPGGKIEEGESPEDCLQRELQEELGITVKVGSFFMENIHQYGEKQILLKAFFCEIVSGEIILNDHDKIEWIEGNEFDTYKFAPADIPFINALNGK